VQFARQVENSTSVCGDGDQGVRVTGTLRARYCDSDDSCESIRGVAHLIVMAIVEGAVAPKIELLTDKGAPLSLKELTKAGKKVVVYFYPKSDTPGCTTEACEFRDEHSKFARTDTVVLGISPDPVKAQAKFQAKFDLPFTLLADVDHAVAEAYGVWVEKSMYGKKYMGVERTTFLIGPEGKIRKIWRKVKPAGHAAEVLAALQT
jgi:peroxiredoxin Q/BCP